MKFLVVDDSKPMRLVMKNLLNQIDRDAEILEATDGAQALDLIDGPLDLVLVDYNMPEKDGLEFVLEFRKAHKETPIIMVTGEAERTKVIDAFRAGVSDYIVRPSPPELIKERIQIALRNEEDEDDDNQGNGRDNAGSEASEASAEKRADAA